MSDQPKAADYRHTVFLPDTGFPMKAGLAATEPRLRWFRRRLPLNLGGIDFSPLVVIAIIVVLNSLLRRLMLYAMLLKQPGLLPF